MGDVLAKLDHAWIVRPVPAAREHDDPIRFRRYEIFHDVLAAPINRAIAARKERRRTRRIRRLGALAIALLLAVTRVAITFAVLANNANNATQAANNEKLTAESRELAAEAAQNDAQDPALSTELALQALQLDQTNEAQQALRAALPGIQAIGTIPDGSVLTRRHLIRERVIGSPARMPRAWHGCGMSKQGKPCSPCRLVAFP